MRRFLSLHMLLLLIAGLLVAWNGSRFIDAKPRIRAKNLDFLPSPVVAKVLCLGQANSVAKLRWIDSFAYFQYQLDRHDDWVPGADGQSGFQRLYTTLTALDPYFQPYYEHAALNIGGILNRHHLTLAFYQLGVLNIPHSTVLWRGAAAELKMQFNWEERNPTGFDGYLAAWIEAEQTEEGKRQVMDWKKTMGSRLFKDLEQIPYWLDKLRSTKPGSSLSDYVETVIRSQLSAYGERELNALVFEYRRLAPRRWEVLYDELAQRTVPFSELLLGAKPDGVARLMAPQLLKRRYGQRLAAFGPIRIEDGRLKLLDDPFGYPWRLEGGRVISPGLEYKTYENRLGMINVSIEIAATKKGTWPRQISDLKDWGVQIPDAPRGGTLRLTEHVLVVDWPKPPSPPWKLR
jgi:hypothetical protein